jgi:hypothetical protein
MRTPYAGEEGGSLAKTADGREKDVSKLRKKKQTIRRPAVPINAIS